MGAVLTFLAAPMLALIAVSFTAGPFIDFPPVGFSLKWYAAVGSVHGLAGAIALSLGLAGIATLVSTLLGIPAAIGIVRGRFPGRLLLMGFLMSPLLVPSVVTGLALLQFVNRVDIHSPRLALVIGHTVLVFPYVLRTIVASLEVLDWSLVETARVLGAGPLRAFWRVILPSIKTGIMVGAIFAFLTSFDNYTISVFLSDAANQPFTVRLYNFMQEGLDPTSVALSALVIYVSVALLLALDRLVGVKKLHSF